MAKVNSERLIAEVQNLRDIEDIRTLMARYHLACDGTKETGTHRNPRDIAALFTADGEWEIPGGTVVGRDDIAATAKQFQAVSDILHAITNPIVTVEGDTASAIFKGFVRSRMAPGDPPLWSIGRYDAIVERSGDDWLFRSLKWEYLDNGGTEDAVSGMVTR